MRPWSGVLVSLLTSSAVWAAPALMPLPQSRTIETSGELTMAGPLHIGWQGCGDPAALDRAGARLNADIVRQTGLVLDPRQSVPVTVTCRSPTRAVDSGEDYRLTVTPEEIRIAAGGPTGALRAFATLRQLVGLSPGGISITAQTIDDAPRFAWRGLMLDPARHFLSTATIRRQIDAMERLKFNTLHLHLSDDQGFRVESRLYPRLNADGPYYRQDEIRALVAYAAERGIRIVPEFDVPGHSRAMIAAYPEVGSVSQSLFLGQPDVSLNPAAPATYRFLERLFGEMAPLFPDRHFHLGGDEVSQKAWADSADVRQLMAREGLTDMRAVEGYFLRKVAAIVRRLGKIVIGWEEVRTAGLPPDTIVQAWQTSNAMADAVAAGHPVIVSAGYYLNLLMPTDFHYAIDPAATDAAGLTPDHADELRRINPLLASLVTDALVSFPRPPLTPEQESRLLGAEAPLWGEIASDELIDHQLWPRAAALAERFWSPASVRDPADMFRRLGPVGDLLTVSGLDDAANRQRLIARLAPGDNGVVATLLDATGPVRNMAHDHRIKAMLAGKRIVQSLNALADAAPVDSLVARRFTDQAARYVAGDGRLAAELRAQLVTWRDNDARFQALAAGRPLLEPARPTSALVKALAETGLAALDARQSGQPLNAADRATATRLLAQVAAQEAASFRPFDAFLRPQPPADLIIRIGPGIRLLVDAAP